MRTVNLALVGFGNVGRKLLEMLRQKDAELRERHGIAWRLTGVASRRIGWIADASASLGASAGGLDIDALLAGRFPAANTSDVREWLAAAKADVLLEASSLNWRTGEPAIMHIRAALEHGAHAASANKGPIVHAYHDLRALAEKKGRRFLFESTVMDGTPIFSLFGRTLPCVELRGFRGLLNSTSNVVLTEMENGLDFDGAVRRAQEIGVAETDPSDDLDGWDPVVKICALAIVLMDVPLKLNDVERQGIRGLSPEAVRAARTEGRPYKLICRAERRGGKVVASVRPEQVRLSDPLAQMQGTTSCLRFDLDVFGLTLIEHKPGVEATAYGLLADMVRCVADERRRNRDTEKDNP